MMLVSVLYCAHLVSGFVGPVRLQAFRRSAEKIKSSEAEDVESVRSLLENQFAQERLYPNVSSSNDILSGTKKRLLQTERRLIEALGTAETVEEFKDAEEGLWRLWFSERGAKNRKRLTEVDELISSGRAFWARAEAKTLELCEEQPNWAEPLNRLATLYYLMGRHDESVQLCEQVIALKPHHFGALSGIVGNHLQRGDAVAAEYWANLRLPTEAAARQRWAETRAYQLDKLLQTRNKKRGEEDEEVS